MIYAGSKSQSCAVHTTQDNHYMTGVSLSISRQHAVSCISESLQLVYERARTLPPLMRALISKDGSMVRYVGTVRYASIFAKKYDTLVRYAFSVIVRVRYVGTVRLFRKGTGTVRRYAL